MAASVNTLQDKQKHNSMSTKMKMFSMKSYAQSELLSSYMYIISFRVHNIIEMTR